MKTKGGASDVIIQAIASLQLTCEKQRKDYTQIMKMDRISAKLIDFLSKQGTQSAKTTPKSLSSNSIVERRFESMSAATRTALAAASHLLSGSGYSSLDALDLIDESNYIPFKRNEILAQSPYTSIQLHYHDTIVIEGPYSFLTFVNTACLSTNTLYCKYKEVNDKIEAESSTSELFAPHFLKILSGSCLASIISALEACIT